MFLPTELCFVMEKVFKSEIGRSETRASRNSSYWKDQVETESRH